MTFERRLAAAEQQHGPQRQLAYTFMPMDIAYTDREAAWIAAERRERGLGPRDELVVFHWGRVQP